MRGGNGWIALLYRSQIFLRGAKREPCGGDVWIGIVEPIANVRGGNVRIRIVAPIANIPSASPATPRSSRSRRLSPPSLPPSRCRPRCLRLCFGAGCSAAASDPDLAQGLRALRRSLRSRQRALRDAARALARLDALAPGRAGRRLGALVSTPASARGCLPRCLK
jgi:hypothetical protein